MRDVETLFHEFWHALHEMLSVSKYSELSWFWVEWDFVELPSQIHENWVSERKSLEKLSSHYKTWKKLDNSFLDKLDELKTFMSWVFVVRQNEFALLDMYLYSEEIPETIKKLDEKTLELSNKFWIFKRKENYKMYCTFNHIFGWGYAAWYYSYMWAEILEADIFEKIKEMWMFKRETWEKFLETVLGQWTKKPARELFFDFMWREVNNKAFMKRKWL
jgi:Zn-dependent oligopeptidase